MEDLRGALEATNWDVLCNPHGDDIDNMVDCVTDYINLCVHNTIPTKDIHCFSNNKPWITSNLKALLNDKKRAFRRGDKEEVKRVQRELKQKLKESKDAYRRKIVPNATMYDYSCVFWNYTERDWSTKGCSKAGDQFGNLRCICNHTTNFAVLMSFKNDYRYSDPLEWITYIGCALSITGLFLTVTYQIIYRNSLKSNHTELLINICISMMVFDIVFIGGISNPKAEEETISSNTSENNMLSSDIHVDPDSGPCTAVAVLLHFFLLSTFTWSSLFAVQNYMLMVTRFVQTPRRFSCWLAALDREGRFDIKKPMLWAFLFPVGIILIFNILVVICFIYQVSKKSSTQERNRKTFLKNFFGSLSLSVVLGVTWLLGYLMLIDDNQSKEVFSYIFCILNTTQGLQIFILFVAKTQLFKEKFSNLRSSISTPETYLHSKTYNVRKFAKRNTKKTFTETENFSTCSL
nr:PREDICTED: adhesion G-protein coupled receptor G7-like [Lepisosteus oculatus]